MSDPKVVLHHGGHHTGLTRRIAGKGVPEGNGEFRTLPLLTESVILPRNTTGKTDTPPIPVRVLHDTRIKLHGGIDLLYLRRKAVHLDVVTGIGKWNFLCLLVKRR